MGYANTLTFVTYLISPEEVYRYPDYASRSTYEDKSNTVREAEEITATLTSIRMAREQDWFDLVGKDSFLSLDKQSREFLINTAGILDLGGPIDIKKVYDSPPYEEKK